MKAAAGRTIAAGLFLAACGSESAPEPPLPALPPFEIRDVIDAELARHEPATGAPAATADEEEELAGLATLVASDATMLDIACADAARIGAASWATLEGLAREESRADAERAAAVDVLACSGAGSESALLRLVTDGEPTWIRRRAAYHLAVGGPDHLIPALILRLKYETDHETVVWLARALARHGNLSGLDGLIHVASDEESEARNLAATELARQVEDFGTADSTELWKTWRLPAEERPVAAHEGSEELRRVVVGWIARLDEFQLRGVDDGRFLFERMDVTAARELGRALHDDSVYVRVHAAQCLQRMGRRGRPAAGELLAALADAELAPHAAEALGHVGGTPARDALLARLGETTPYEVRLACMRGLGFLDGLTPAEARAACLPLFDSELPDLAQAAAESLLRLDPEALEAVARLADCLTDRRVAAGSSERALRAWLAATGAEEALAAWGALAPPADRAETVEEAAERLQGRADLVRTLAR